MRFVRARTWAVFAIVAGASVAAGGPAGAVRHAFRAPRTYTAPGGGCSVRISMDDIGGFARLELPAPSGGHGKSALDDVTGAVFTGPSTLAYSVGPSYGKPGIYSFDCGTKTRTRIVAPKTVNRVFPEGADYFELIATAGDRLFFYFAPDLDKANRKTLRSAVNLYTVATDGRDFRRATDAESRAIQP